MRKLLLLLPLFLTSLLIFEGCAKNVVLHPVDGQDIKLLDDGWIAMSPKYVEEVVQVKLKAKGL